jgi:PAS domain S-box-containing protein
VTPPTTGGSGNVAESARAVLVTRRDGTTVHVSDGFCRLIGLSRDEMVGRSASAFGLADRTRERWVLERLPAPGQAYRYVREIGTAHGPLLASIELHAMTLGEEDIIVATMAPAPTPETASDADVLSLVLDRAPVGVVVYDSDLRIVRVNTRVEQMGRITPAHIGMRLDEVFPDVAPGVVDAIRKVFATGEQIVNMEATGGDGVNTYLLSLFPIAGANGSARWVGCVFSDVTDRVLAEQALADSERRRREILITMLQAEENERSRIATELHDDTVQVMTAALLSMDRVALVARKAGDMKLESAVMHTRATLEEATDRTRRLMFELRPAILHENGLRAALRVLADQTARATNATARVRCEPARYDPSIEELVYRTIQEALANIRKHAAAERISVTVTEDAGALRGVVRDDGRGFDVVAARSRPDAAFHLGIAALVERVRAAGGDASITSRLGRGTRVWFSIPLGGPV